MERRGHVRVLMYSHDTFGLGHLTRCRTIANSLIRRYKGLVVLIITGSPIAGTFSFPARVDFVKIPSVIKLYNGEYTSMYEHINLHETFTIREAIIRQTAKSFKPDLFIVDKVPLGLRGELEDTLVMLKQQGVSLVLGLRDVMDSPERLKEEWAPNDVLRKVGNIYDRVWIYGTREFWNPLQGLDVPGALDAKIVFTGYLKRQPVTTHHSLQHSFTNPYVLVTVGGGGDGDRLVDWVLSACESEDRPPYPVLFVLGPFMKSSAREAIRARATALENVQVIDFENNMSQLMMGAVGVVAMGGYNTYCEILSYDKRAIIVPRAYPRHEQLIRATRAQEMGLITMLHPDNMGDTEIMAKALRALPSGPLPSQAGQPGLLDGLETIDDEVGELLYKEKSSRLAIVESGS